MEKKISSRSEGNDRSGQSPRNQYIKLIFALGALLIIAGIFIVILSWPLMTGTETILATRPVDPFDIFRGQYITIAYDIGNVQVPPEVEEGDRIYVVLKEDNESIARFDRVSLVKPDDILFIKGTVTDISGTFARVDYGIGQYFFERGAEFPTRNLQVRVKIAKNGQARIDALLINKTVIEMNYKNFSWKD